MKPAHYIWIIFGIIFTGIGMTGVFLPILPTTPFVLLAAICFSKGSMKMHDKLLNSKLLGGYIRDYKEGKGMLLGRKITALIFLWVSIGYSIIFAVPNIYGKATLFVIACAVTTHLLVMKTRKNP